MKYFIRVNDLTAMFRFRFVITLSAVVLLGMNGRSAKAQGVVPDATERAALMALFNSTMSTLDTTLSSNWSPSKIKGFPNTTLSGVSVSNGDITQISLSSRQLTGNLPSEMANLTQLRVLDLGSNSLSANLPDLSPLSNLTTLSLNNNNFANHSFPSGLGNLTALEYLDLTSCNLDGPVPSSYGGLSNLKYLFLGSNKLGMSNSIPNTFSNLDNLLNLNLRGCSLTAASVDTGLSGLASVTWIDMSFNPLFTDNNFFPDKLANLPALTDLILEQNGFRKFPISLSQLPKLNNIDLSQTVYSDSTRLGEVIDVLKICPQLKTLKLQYCNIAGLPPDFDHLLTVQNLDMSYNPQLDTAHCKMLGTLPQLKNLTMVGCNLLNLPVELRLSNTLEMLNVSNNKLKDLPEVIKEIQNLKILNISWNGIDELPVWFGTGNKGRLQELDASHNNLDDLPANFTHMFSIMRIDLSYNKLTNQWPDGISNMGTVTYFDVSHNNITLLPDLSLWWQLQYLYVQNNQLKGQVPVFLTQMTDNKVMIEVNMSYNQFNATSADAYFGPSTRVAIAHNKFTFKQVEQLTPGSNLFLYSYAPQDTTVDAVRDVKVLQPAPITLSAFAIDTLAYLQCKFQWYKYIDGVHDSLMTAASYGAKTISFPARASDQGSKFYYTITHGALTSLVLKSNLLTVVILCESVPRYVNFTATRYLCAMGFVPSVTYEAGCHTKTIDWNFGDGGNSQDKSPMHAYANGGTYPVSMKIQYTCGICLRDTVMTRNITYNLAEDFLKDSLVTVATDVKQQVITAAAATFSDAWSLQHNTNYPDTDPYSTGAEGVWRNDGTYVYQETRKLSEPTNIAVDGTFNLDFFNYEQAEIEAIPNWTKASTMTEYSPYSYELENRDVMGIYTAALYDYGGHLPSANGVNMRNREMAFTGFEFIDQKSTGNWVFGTQPLPASYTYEVYSAKGNIAIVKASLTALADVAKVDVAGKALAGIFLTKRYSNSIPDDEIVCMEGFPSNPEWSIIVLRKAPFTGTWHGTITSKNNVVPEVSPDIDNGFAHTGASSLKIGALKTFKQELLHLDSGKTYYINGWVSTVNSAQVSTPWVGADLGIVITLKDKNGVTKLSPQTFVPSGPVIEGWQQVKGTFKCPDNYLKLEIAFKPGDAGVAWYDDLRLHPENGNMKCYVYDLRDYRLRAILDEENFASLFYYDKEGNLYVTKKETEQGIKTISENVTYMKGFKK
jgi:Leucine-rich repeat (LRR) protein